MASAPAVQSLQDLVGQFSAAQAPESANIDQSIAQNEQSGAGQIAGVEAARNNAFSGITQNANDRGMNFSGFTPNQEATYTGSTYLPALAKIQQAIAGVRGTLLGQKASLATTANTNALGERNNEQKALDAWDTQQAAQAQQEKLQQEQEQFTAGENTKNRANAVAVAGAKANALTAAQAKQQDMAAMATALKNGNKQLGITNAGGDGYVSPQNYAAAKAAWVSNGYPASEFDSAFSNFRNPANANYQVGSTSSAANTYGL